MDKTSPTDPVDAVPAFAHHTPGVVAAGFSGLGNDEVPVENNRDYNSPPATAQENPSAAEESTVPPVASWMEEPMLLCRWCGFMVRFGRGPVKHIDNCNLCRAELEAVAQ